MEPTFLGAVIGVLIGVYLLLWQYFRYFAIKLWKKIVSIASVLTFFVLIFTLPNVFLLVTSISWKSIYGNQLSLIQLFQTIGIIFSIWVGTYNIRRAVRLDKLRTLSDITKSNRELLTFYISHQEKLSRVFSNSLTPSLEVEAVSLEERFYINLLILHFNVIFNSMENKIFPEIEKLEIDIGGFLNLPLPNTVWNQTKIYQNIEFTKFVDSCIANQDRNKTS